MHEPTLLPIVETPIACSLDATELTDRLSDWRRILAGVTARTQGDGPHEVVLQLSQDTSVGELAVLCADEVACCPFFRFDVTITADGLQLRVAVPAGAEPVLAEFSQLLPATAR